MQGVGTKMGTVESYVSKALPLLTIAPVQISGLVTIKRIKGERAIHATVIRTRNKPLGSPDSHERPSWTSIPAVPVLLVRKRNTLKPPPPIPAEAG